MRHGLRKHVDADAAREFRGREVLAHERHCERARAADAQAVQQTHREHGRDGIRESVGHKRKGDDALGAHEELLAREAIECRAGERTDEQRGDREGAHDDADGAGSRTHGVQVKRNRGVCHEGGHALEEVRQQEDDKCDAPDTFRLFTLGFHEDSKSQNDVAPNGSIRVREVGAGAWHGVRRPKCFGLIKI